MASPMKIRANLLGDVANVKCLISHPMETGLRKDPKTGAVVPAHFITEVSLSINGAVVATLQWGAGVSKNPYLAMQFKGCKAGDKVTISCVDNKGESLTGAATVA